MSAKGETIREHFSRRARERGISSVNGDALWRDLLRFIRGQGGIPMEHVMDLDGGASVWRFILPVEGPCYTIVSNDVPKTIITAEMVKLYKTARKKRGSPRLWKEEKRDALIETFRQDGRFARRRLSSG